VCILKAVKNIFLSAHLHEPAPVKQTQRENAYHYIRQKLLAGDLPAGGRVSAAALAREIGISHIPVREAISQLRSEGLIVHQSHRGAFAKVMNRLELADLIEFRAVLEGHAAARAARRIGPAELQQLDERWQDLSATAAAFRVPPGTDLRDLLRNWLLADLAFHMVLLRAAGNRHVIRAIENARVMTHMFGYRNDTPTTWSDPATFGSTSLGFHKDIYEAIRRRDPKSARRAMAAHMRHTRKHLLARYDWIQRQSNVDNRLLEEFPDSMREAVHDIQRRVAEDATITASEATEATPVDQPFVSARKPRGALRRQPAGS
jgi:DNA-binding GntR family transcriptional regulator